MRAFERLSKDVVPFHYDLEAMPLLDDGVFKGKVDIKVEIKKGTNVIDLDAEELEFHQDKCCFILANGDKITASSVQLVKEPIDRVRFTYASELPIGIGTIHAEYNGILNERMEGFYRNKYTDVNGKQKWGATTQFEPCSARLCLPCFDEPALKATFGVTLIVPKHMTALSNMPVVKVVDHEQDGAATWKQLTYDTTPKMSTYLLAFCIGEYDFVEGTTSDGKIVARVYTAKGRKEQGQFALDFGIKTLEYYEKLFGVPFPLPKMDMIAIENFAAGAMENWGLITYREVALLVNPENPAASSKQRVALVVAHELAHMWFGNLVTMDWWSGLWLNEGFATFVMRLGVDHCYPEWKIWDQFVDEVVSSAMGLDSMKSTHPIQVEVGHPEEVEQIFDQISYEKGASVIRMLWNYIGAESFEKGLQDYLKTYAYGNATTENLWEKLEQATNGKYPVGKVMRDWTLKPGYPFVSVTYQDEKLKLSQNKFSAIASEAERKATINSTETWRIPIEIKIGSENTKVLLMEATELTVDLSDCDVTDETPIIVNPGRKSFYRVGYSEDLLKRLTTQLQNSNVTSTEAMVLQDDVHALVMASRINLSVYLQFLKEGYKGSNKDLLVWRSVLMNVNGMRGLLSSKTELAEVSAAFNKFVREFACEFAEYVGWDKKIEGVEQHLVGLARELVLGLMVTCKSECHVQHAQKLLRTYSESKKAGDASAKPIPAQLRAPVFGSASSLGREGYDMLRTLYENSTEQVENVRLLVAMPNNEDLDVVEDAFKWSFNEARAQDLMYVLIGVASRPKSRNFCWQYIQDNIESVQKVLPSKLMGRCLKLLLQNYSDTSVIPGIEEFFKANPIPAADRPLEQAIENINVRSTVLNTETEVWQSWLKSL